MRRLLPLAIVLCWMLVLAVFAQIPLSAPPWPGQRLSMDGASFSAYSGAQLDGSALLINAEGEGHSIVMVRQVDIDDAASLPVLRYQFEDVPATLELVFVYRRADSPSDVRTVALTSARSATGTLDLSREPDWRDRIQEIGFAVYPATQSVPPERGFHPFTLRQVELWSPSWLGRVAATATEWSGRRNWSLMSISALGPDSGATRGSSPTLFLLVGMGATAWLLLALGQWPRQRVIRVLFALTAASWLSLDVRWVLSLSDRHAATRLVYAPADWRERQLLQPDTDLFAAAHRIRDVLAERGVEFSTARILVDATTDYERARLIYHLVPANTLPVNLGGWGTRELNQGMFAVAYGVDWPRFDAQSSQLELEDERLIPAVVVIDEPPLRVYRLGATEVR